MSVADKLLQVNQVKQDIKTAIETKGVPMTNVAFTDYANKILDISGGGGVVDEYFYYAKSYYTITNNSTLFENAWSNHNKRTTLFDGNISLVVTDDSMGMPLSFYSGVGVDELYDLLASGGARQGEYLKITVNNTVYDATSIDSVTNTGVALRFDNQEGIMYVAVDEENNYFLIVMDTTFLGMPYGKAIVFNGNENVNYLKIESGFNHYYENGIIIPDGVEIVPDSSYRVTYGAAAEYLENNDFPLIIPNSVTSIGDYAFGEWRANNQPLVIPSSVTEIGEQAFYSWQSNNQPLVIPNSVTSIGNSAFSFWTSNNQPLVIPNSATSIGEQAFYSWQSNNQPLVIPNSVTSIESSAFSYWSANNQPLVIPNSVTSIGNSAFSFWTSNTHPLVIPESVTSIGGSAFYSWSANNQPLVIPNSVTSIGVYAFLDWESVPYVEIQSLTPPTLVGAAAFYGQGNAPIYVPDESVDDYKTATNWVDLADRIFSINDK